MERRDPHLSNRCPSLHERKRGDTFRWGRLQRCQVVAQVDNFGVAHAPWFCRAGGGSWGWSKSWVRSRLGFWLRQEKMDIVSYIQYNYYYIYICICIYIWRIGSCIGNLELIDAVLLWFSKVVVQVISFTCPQVSVNPYELWSTSYKRLSSIEVKSIDICAWMHLWMCFKIIYVCSTLALDIYW